MQFKFDKPDQKPKSGLGCLYGCAALLLVVMLFLTAGYFYFRDRLSGVTEVENLSKQLDEKYGTVDDFYPAADGGIPAERILVFLELRDSLKSYEAKASSALQTMSHTVDDNTKEGDAGISEIYSIVTSGLNLMPDLIDYIKAKYLLLDRFEMSKGEYFYIYTLAYYNYLGHKPGDGPDFRLVTDKHKDDEAVEGEDVIIRREKENRDIINSKFRKILKNQIINASKTQDKELVLKVREEIDRLLKNPFSMPWENSLPVAIAGSFTNYRDRLENQYNFELNPVEIMLIE
ncbi:MAG: hypothetical protein SCALA702_32690 [Melioribacteraceae bacterium]|nr:MAG: hypothetical protein SCALA702_32690 [Melioribacteraceae bacterium]